MTTQSHTSETEFLYTLANSGRFDRLVRYLGSDDPLAVRRTAAELLTQFADELAAEASDELTTQLSTAVLTETDDTVRAKTVETLVSADDAIIDSLVGKIESETEPTPTDSPHPLLLIEWLDSEYAALRRLAVAGLGRVETAAVVPQLAAACDDTDPRVRERALRECGRAGDHRCVDAVADCLDSDRECVRTAAASALAALGTDDATAEFLSAATADDLAVRRTVIAELGATGALEVFGCLLHALDGGPETIRDAAVTATVELIIEAPPHESHIVRETVTKQLATIPNHVLVPRITDLATDSDSAAIRRNAIWLLGRIATADPQEGVLDCFITALADTDAKTARIAASSLARLGEPAIIEQLESFIKSNELDSETLSRADFVRERLTDTGASERRKDVVTYRKVSDPAEYAHQQADPE